MRRSILVTGGAGYVGAVLVPRLLQRGHAVTALDLYAFGDDTLAAVRDHPELVQVKADIRDLPEVRRALVGVDTVIHLACISNDPGCELEPELSRQINYEAFEPLVRLSLEVGVERFVFASSASVYGVSDAPEVTEEHALRPLTLYNTYKGMCEAVLFRYQTASFTTVAIRPATLCGCSPRQRLDLTVNVLTAQAVARGRITVFGGAQQRPNLHLDDMVDLYLLLLAVPAQQIAGQAFNAGYQNRTVADVAALVKAVVEREMPERAPVTIETTASDDPRSYHISSEKLRRRLGFVPRRTIEDAIRDLVAAFRAGRIPDPLTDERYYTVKVMRRLAPVLLRREGAPLPAPGARHGDSTKGEIAAQPRLSARAIVSQPGARSASDGEGVADAAPGVRDRIDGEDGFATGLRLQPGELEVARDLIEQHWLSRLRSAAPHTAQQFAALGLGRYHELSRLVDHATMWPKRERILPAGAVQQLRQTSLFRRLDEEFGAFVISDEDGVGWEEIYWRIVRPGEPSDVGPLHADRWFWELGHGTTPPWTERIKVWVAVTCEPGRSGLRVVPGSHRRAWRYHGQYRHGMMKPVIDESEQDLHPQLVPTSPGDALVFHDGLLHGGAVSAGCLTRVSFEFTMLVPRHNTTPARTEDAGEAGW